MKRARPKVFVIILNYNGRETLFHCLSSVFRSDYPDLKVVVVDNNSQDESLEIAKKNFSQAYFIENSENIGFAAGNNIGIRFALERMADYIFLLNNDAEVERKTISNIIQIAEKNSSLGILSPLIYKNKTEKIWFAGGKIDWLRMRAIHTDFKIKSKKSKLWSTDYISGCAMLIKKEVFKKIGLLNEDYFLYYEDVDFSWRAYQSGFQLMVTSESRVYHFEKSEENKPAKIYWLVLSGILFFRKNAPLLWRPYISVYLWLRKIKNQMDLKWRNNQFALETRRAYRDSEKLNF